MPEKNSYQVIISELVRRSNEETRRLRALEQRMDAIETRLASLEENALEKAKKGNERFAAAEAALRRLEDEVITLKNSVDKINKQMLNFARKRDIKEIENMLELMKPVQEEGPIAMTEVQ